MPNIGAPELLFGIVIWAVFVVLTAWLAAKKGYSPVALGRSRVLSHLDRADHRARAAEAGARRLRRPQLSACSSVHVFVILS